MLIIGLFLTSISTAAAKPNVLFIVADDLRPEMGLYGGDAVTPHLDKFAATAGTVVFNRAYVQQAICNPTRSSFLTGRRPDTTKVWDLKTQFRLSGGNFTTLPQFFRESGWYTAGMGKVFHPIKYEGKIDDVMGGSWSAPYYHAPGLPSSMAMCWTENPSNDSLFVDDMVAAHGIQTMQNLTKKPAQPAQTSSSKDSPVLQVANSAEEGVATLRAHVAATSGAARTGTPVTSFFVAVGLHRPHLPWDVPAHYFDLYPLDKITLADHNTMPLNYNITGAQPWSWDPQSGPRHCGPLNNETLPVEKQKGEYALVPDPIAKNFRRGYFAAVSQTDANAGKVLDELEALGVVGNTIVAFLGDHGWQLGDLGEFGKKTNFERATRTPLIIRAPQSVSSIWSASPAGKVVYSNALVEFVDIMPTLIDLAGLQVPPVCPRVSTNIRSCTEGVSLKGVMADPVGTKDTFKAAAFMQYAHCMHDEPGAVWHDACGDGEEPKVMGYALRTRRWRYIEWVKFDHTTTPPTAHWDQLMGTELYDHTTDDTVENAAESINLVADPTLATTVKQLSAQLHSGWRAV